MIFLIYRKLEQTIGNFTRKHLTANEYLTELKLSTTFQRPESNTSTIQATKTDNLPKINLCFLAGMVTSIDLLAR